MKSKKRITTNIKVEVWDIEVDDYYFSFNYRITDSKGEFIKEGLYESDHIWLNDKEGFMKVLEEGDAVVLALESYE
jgi:hypothetical protein